MLNIRTKITILSANLLYAIIEGGGGDMRINENSPPKWPNTHSQKLFLRINENSPRKWPNTHSQKLFISLFRIMSSVKKERDISID